jgi:Fur family ferric uptake transcriptional regulator
MSESKPQRNTRQRQVILEELQKLTSHPTAVGLYEVVRQRLPKISLGTVYRNLERLAETGQIVKLQFGGGQARFDGELAHHDHVRCVRCGRVDDVYCAPLALPPAQGEDFGGYQIIGHRLEFFGVCPQCRQPSPSTQGACAC